VFYVDMDGLHDGQAIKTIVSDLQPRKLVGTPLLMPVICAVLMVKRRSS
jgi:hypothetical protein